MKNRILKACLIYIPIMGFIFLIVYISGFYFELHKNAYRDIFRSVSIPYAIWLLYLLVSRFKISEHKSGYYKKIRDINQTIKVHPSSTKLIGKIKKRVNLEQNFIYDILEVFMLITVVNSLMMVFGIDPSPKVGKFAYVHLMMRLTIISLIMIVIRGKKTVADIKNLIAYFKKLHKFAELKSYIIVNIKSHKYKCVYVLFTTLTILICVFTIVFLSAPIGGIPFYTYLVVQFLIIIIAVGIINFIFSYKRKKLN